MILYKSKDSETVRVDGGNGSCEDCLPRTNTLPFTPTNDYNPATKKYVDDLIGDIAEILDEINRKPGSLNPEPHVEPFYLYNGSEGINKLGEFYQYVQNAINGSPQISISDSITVTINKGAQVIVVYSIQHNNFNINNIEQYSKLVTEFEYTSGKFTYDVAMAYFKSNSNSSSGKRIHLNNSTDESLDEEIGDNSTVYGYDTDKIHGIKYHTLTSDEKTLLTSVTSNERLGIAISASYNNVVDTIFKIHKIWLEE